MVTGLFFAAGTWAGYHFGRNWLGPAALLVGAAVALLLPTPPKKS